MRERTAPAIVVLLAVLLVVGGAVALTAGSTGPGVPAVPGEGVGSRDVRLSTYAASHPAAVAVAEQLQHHYDAINVRDYTMWRDTVVPARVEALPEDDWLDAYATTYDGSINVDRIDSAADGAMLVRVRFVSTQAVEDAPPDLRAPRICWRSTLLMRGTPPLIDATGGGSSTREAC